MTTNINNMRVLCLTFDIEWITVIKYQLRTWQVVTHLAVIRIVTMILLNPDYYISMILSDHSRYMPPCVNYRNAQDVKLVTE